MTRSKWGVLAVCLTVGLAAAQQFTADEQAAMKALDRADGLANAGKAGDALAAYDEARNKAGRQVWVMIRAWFGDGRVRQAHGDFAKAAAALTNAVALTKVEPGTPIFPDRPEILEHLAQCEQARGNTKAARAWWDEIDTIAPHSVSRLIADRARIGQELRDGNLPAAGKQLDAWLKLCPWAAESPYLLASVAEALANAGKPAEALVRLEQLRRDYPLSEPLWSSRGLVVACRRALKQHDVALGLLNEVLTQRPELAVVTEAAIQRAQTLVDKGDLPGALAGLDEIAARYRGGFAEYKLGFVAASLVQENGKLPDALVRYAALNKAFPAAYCRTQTLRAMLDIYKAQRKPEDWEAASDCAQALVDLTASPERTGLAAEALLDKAQLERDAGKLRAAKLTLAELKKYVGPPFVPLAEELERQLKQ